MKFKKHVKYYNEGIHKSIHPSLTCQMVMTALCKNNLYKKTVLSNRGIERLTNFVPTVIIEGNECIPYTSGKGHTIESATASAFMEYVERYSCVKYLISKYEFGSANSLGINYNFDELFNALPTRDMNIVRTLSNEEMMNQNLKWYSVENLITEETRKIPLNLILSAINATTGLAAGNTYEEAIVQGLCECIERHDRTIVETELRNSKIIEGIENPIILDLLENFDKLKQPYWLKYISTLGFPTVAFVRQVGEYYLVNAGCALDVEEAIIRAITESLQVEPTKIQYEINEHDVSHYLTDIGSINIKDIEDMSCSTFADDIQMICNKLEKYGMTGYFADTWQDNIQIPAVIVYVAGMKHLNSVGWPYVDYYKLEERYYPYRTDIREYLKMEFPYEKNM